MKISFLKTSVKNITNRKVKALFTKQHMMPIDNKSKIENKKSKIIRVRWKNKKKNNKGTIIFFYFDNVSSECQ